VFGSGFQVWNKLSSGEKQNRTATFGRLKMLYR